MPPRLERQRLGTPPTRLDSNISGDIEGPSVALQLVVSGAC